MKARILWQCYQTSHGDWWVVFGRIVSTRCGVVADLIERYRFKEADFPA